jgi:homocysteine S-methyltransferase
MIESPIAQFFRLQGFFLLDGGLATELEKLGNDLKHHLWSARLIREKPQDILSVHRAFLEAGADCIASVSYQATIPGLMAEGLTLEEAGDAIDRAVKLACSARDDFVGTSRFRNSGRLAPLVAASLGPYGAYLADGSEYDGNYGLSVEDLHEFHLPRWEILNGSEADLVACETIPSFVEAQALKELIEGDPTCKPWVSFSCKDGENISDGTPIRECAELFQETKQLLGLGINCTAPRFVLPLIEQIKSVAPDMPVAVYPNSGEDYDAATHSWAGVPGAIHLPSAARKWLRAGASMIGGCCRTSPETITALRGTLIDECGSNID